MKRKPEEDTNLHLLAVDTLKHIFSFLRPSDAVSFALVSSRHYSLCKKHQLVLPTITTEQWTNYCKKAIKLQNYETLKLLLNHNATSKKINTILRWTTKNQHASDVITFFMQQPNLDLSPYYKDAFIVYCKEGKLEIVKYFIESLHLDPTFDGSRSFPYSCISGAIEVVQYLLKQPGVDPTVQDNAAIGWASAKGHVEIVKLLLQYPGVHPTANNDYALRMASSGGHTDVVKLLLQYPGVDPNVDHHYAICMASSNGHLDVIRLLLQHPTVDKTRIMHIACRRGDVTIVRLMLEIPGIVPTPELIRVAQEYGTREVETLLLECSRKEVDH